MEFNFPKETLIEKEQRKAFLSYWFRRIFIDDWLIKLTALLITLALWFGVTGFQAPTTTRLRSVTLNPLVSNQLEITNTPIQEVDLVVTGEKRKIDQLNPRELVVSLDLTTVPEGERTVQISAENITVDLPPGVKIDEVRPNKTSIKLEKVEEYQIPIRAETTGDLEAGYEVYSTKITPDKVRVRGPKSFVESLNFVSTEKINIAGKDGNFSAQQIPLNIINPKVKPIDVVSANVFFRIGKKRIERLLVVPYQTDTREGRASVLLYGPNEVLEELTAGDLQIVEDRNESGTGRLGVILPEALRDEVEIKNVRFRE